MGLFPICAMAGLEPFQAAARSAMAVEAGTGVVRGGLPGGGARSSRVTEAGLPSSPCSLPFYLDALDLVRAGYSSPLIIAATCSSISSPAPSLHGHAKDTDAPLAGWMDAAPSPATSSSLLQMWRELEHHCDEGHTRDPRRQERHTRRQGRARRPPELSWRWPFFNLTLVKVFNLTLLPFIIAKQAILTPAGPGMWG
jgi:hypothetical protein